jgi:hypothetical protein
MIKVDFIWITSKIAPLVIRSENLLRKIKSLINKFLRFTQTIAQPSPDR